MWCGTFVLLINLLEARWLPMKGFIPLPFIRVWRVDDDVTTEPIPRGRLGFGSIGRRQDVNDLGR
jgi:hypothetical protein